MGENEMGAALDAFADETAAEVRVVVEAPAGSRNKYKYDEQVQAIVLDNALPAGAVFPYDYGFIPGTRGEDGDPLDVLLILDAPTFPGCVATGRLIGVIHARQREKDGSVVENDRLIAVAAPSKDHAALRSLDDLGHEVLDQLEHFFVSYHALDGTHFEPLGRGDVDAAREAVRQAQAAAGDGAA